MTDIVGRLREYGDFYGANLCIQAADQIEHLRQDLADAQQDTQRLVWLIQICGLDDLGGGDMHDKAFEFAEIFGRTEPNDEDYLAAFRTVIDKARHEKPAAKEAK